MNRSTRRGFLAGIAGAVAAIGGTTAVEDVPKLPADVIRTYEAGETVWGDRYTLMIENGTAGLTDDDVRALASRFADAITQGVDVVYGVK